MTAREKTERDAAIFAARARGLGWARIAAQHGVSERQAQRIYAEHRCHRPSPIALDPVAVVEEALDGLAAAVEELAELSDSTSHDGVRLGAIRARVDVLTTRMNLLMAVGVLPQDLGRLGREREVQEVIQTITRVFADHGVPPEVQDALCEALKGRPPGNGHTNGYVEGDT
jgi:hypothetical protein